MRCTCSRGRGAAAVRIDGGERDRPPNIDTPPGARATPPPNMLAPLEAEAEPDAEAAGAVVAAAALADPSAKSASAGGDATDADESALNMPEEKPRSAGEGATMLCVLDVKSAR